MIMKCRRVGHENGRNGRAQFEMFPTKRYGRLVGEYNSDGGWSIKTMAAVAVVVAYVRRLWR